MRVARRCVDAVVAMMTWAVAAFVVLWFYDWVSRWYVVVGALLVVVGVAMAGERRPRGGESDAGALAATSKQPVVPAPRDGASVAPGWYAPEEKIA